MANPAFRAAGTKTTGSSVTTISVPAPAGHQAGDLLILFAQSFASPSGTTVATPSGWTLFTGGASSNWFTSGRCKTYVFWKLATSSSEPNVSVVQAASGFPEGVMYAYQGDIDQVTPVDATGGWGTPGSAVTLFPAAALTTVTDNALVVYLGLWTNTVVTSSAPNSSTQRYVSTFFNTEFHEADITKTPAGTLAAANWVLTTSSSGTVFAFAIKPAAAAAPAFVPRIVMVT